MMIAIIPIIPVLSKSIGTASTQEAINMDENSFWGLVFCLSKKYLDMPYGQKSAKTIGIRIKESPEVNRPSNCETLPEDNIDSKKTAKTIADKPSNIIIIPIHHITFCTFIFPRLKALGKAKDAENKNMKIESNIAPIGRFSNDISSSL